MADLLAVGVVYEERLVLGGINSRVSIVHFVMVGYGATWRCDYVAVLSGDGRFAAKRVDVCPWRLAATYNIQLKRLIIGSLLHAMGVTLLRCGVFWRHW